MMLRGQLVTAVILSCFSGTNVFAQDDVTARQTVVKIFCTSNQLNLSSPWKRGSGAEASGSGVWLGGNRILTNEHLVDYPTQISVQPYESAERLPADVVFVSPEMDLAIIEVDGDLPFEELEPPQFAKTLPSLRSTVRVYGYPEGGTSLSVTEGIVSRIEYRPYTHGEFGLRIQVDAAINPGNSGGPAYVDDEIIGLAFQRRSRSDNIGYLIPSEEVLRFLRNAEENKPGVKPRLPIRFQRLVNVGLRRKLKLDRTSTGVWVRELMEVEEDEYPIQIGDIITHIADHNIDNSGQARLADDLLVNFEYFVPQLVSNGSVPLRIIRDGKEQSVDAPVQQPKPRLLPPLKGRYPDYFVYGPMVFISGPADFVGVLENLLASSDSRQRLSGLAGFTTLARRRSPLVTRRYDLPAFDGEELVMIANWLPHRLRIGYGAPNMQVIDTINGIDIRNLKHLVETLRDLDDDFVEIQFAESQVETLIFEREKIVAANEDILLNNGIPRQGSPELLRIWNGD